MSGKIKIIVVILLVSIGVGSFFVLRPSAKTALDIPDLTPRSGETTPSPEFQKAQATIVRYRDEVHQHPAVVKNYVELAQVYLQEARITGKHHQYLPIADHILDVALSYEPKNFDASILKASMLMTLHQFPKARDMAEQAIASNPYNAFAYGVLCDAHVELGQYDAAVKDCDKMMSTRPDLRSYARASYLRELHGDREGAISAMKLAADVGEFGQENREWALYNLANIFLGMGKLDTAAFIYRGILEERPNYAFAMSGLAQVAYAKGDNAGAIEWLVKASQVSPEHIFVEQLADIYHATGDKQAEKTMEDKALDAFKSHEQNGWDVDREVAVFLLNHDLNIPEALERAKREYDRRPENIDALDTYAWALYRSGRGQEALPIIQQAMRLKTENGILHYHAASIYSSLNRSTDAATEIKLAFTETPYLNIATIAPATKLRTSLSQVASLN